MRGMTLTRQNRSKNRLRSADRPRLQAHLLAAAEPAETVKKAMVADNRSLETELLRARASLRLIAESPVGVDDDWRQFARDAWEVTR
jgi:hypothetical protein